MSILENLNMQISKFRRIRELLPMVPHSGGKDNFNQQSSSCMIPFIWILEKAKGKRTVVARGWATKCIRADRNVLYLDYGGSYETMYVKINRNIH